MNVEKWRNFINLMNDFGYAVFTHGYINDYNEMDDLSVQTNRNNELLAQRNGAILHPHLNREQDFEDLDREWDQTYTFTTHLNTDNSFLGFTQRGIKYKFFSDWQEMQEHYRPSAYLQARRLLHIKDVPIMFLFHLSEKADGIHILNCIWDDFE